MVCWDLVHHTHQMDALCVAVDGLVLCLRPSSRSHMVSHAEVPASEKRSLTRVKSDSGAHRHVAATNQATDQSLEDS